MRPPRKFHELMQQASRAIDLGEFGVAETCARAALQASPTADTALNLLGYAQHLQARHDEAIASFERLVAMRPQRREYWVNFGTALREADRLDEAAAAYHRAYLLGERSAGYLFNIGLLAVARGDHDTARQAFGDAHRAQPRDAEIACNYASACWETMQVAEGLDALAGWREFDGLDPVQMAALATLMMTLGNAREAGAALDQAMTAPVLEPYAVLQLAMAFERMNRLDQARELLARLQSVPEEALGPELTAARAKLAQRDKQHEVAVEAYRRLVAQCPAPEMKFHHLFPLAQSLDALGRYDEAFAALLEAHESQTLRIQKTHPDVCVDRRDAPETVRSGCNVEDVRNWNHEGAPGSDDSPIFIVAFPRSGTTLLEQTLEANPRLRSLDEQPYLQNAAAMLKSFDVRYPENMAALTREQLDQARAFYWSRVRRNVELRPGEQLIDKNPLNILHLPAIARLFPHSRTILAVRHPFDVLLSGFMQVFRAVFAWQCRDLQTMASTYHRTMSFWYQQTAVLGLDTREVRYEALVADFEPQVRGIASWLGLEWNDAMLAPADHARAKGFITSPSYAQVTQGVHLGSVARWRAYAKHLEPVLPTLQPWLDRWGYEFSCPDDRDP